MGYYSDFEIHIHSGYADLESVKNSLEKVSDYTFYTTNDSIVSTDSYKWYSNEEDMRELSTLFPDIILVLTWIGEDDQRGRSYYYNGRSQEVTVNVVYEKPDLIKLKKDY